MQRTRFSALWPVLALYLLFQLTNLGAFAFSTSQPGSASQTHRLELKIIDPDGNALSGASVFINDSWEQTSNPEGKVFFDLEPGTYQLQSYRANYLDYTSTVSINAPDLSLEITHQPSRFWTTTTSNPPIGVGENNGQRLAALGDHIYFWVAFGAEAGTTTYSASNHFYAYHTPTDTWKRLPNAPAWGNSIYGIGTAAGVNASGHEAVYIIKGHWTGQKTWFARYRPDTNSWEDNLNNQIPWKAEYTQGGNIQTYPRNGATLVNGHDGYMYLFPGSGYSYRQRDWYRYSIADDRWEALPQLPSIQGPGNAAVFVRGQDAGLQQDYLYVHFGTAPSGSYHNAEFWRYGLKSQKWEKPADHAFGADDGSALVWDGANHIYHSPGAYAEQSWDKASSQKRAFMRYSINTNTWEQMENTPYNPWGGWDDAGGLTIVGNHIYGLKGGCDIRWAADGSIAGGGSVASAEFWRYTITDQLYTLQIETPQGEGQVTPAPLAQEYPQGSQIELWANPAQGWVFNHWVVNDYYYGIDNPTELTFNNHKSVKAVFVMLNTAMEPNIKPRDTVYYHTNNLFATTYSNTQTLWVHDIQGRSIFRQALPAAGKHQIPLALKPGIYIISFYPPNKPKGQKILVP